jgi:hypothetical protein
MTATKLHRAKYGTTLHYRCKTTGELNTEGDAKQIDDKHSARAINLK